ncbi:MAG: sensor histidine kinase [Acidimicrobiales bacterium]
MRYRSRLAVATGTAVAVAIALASLAVYLSVRAQLQGALARSLVATASAEVSSLARSPAGTGPGAGGSASPAAAAAQLVTTGGAIVPLSPDGLTLPEVAGAEAVAAGRAGPFLSQVEVGDTRLLVYTRAAGRGRAVQIAASLADTESTLDRLAVVLASVTAAGLLLAVLAGLATARALLAPLQRLGETAAHVAATLDLSRRLDVTANDELGRIASSFNTMMSALEQSLRAQRQLVADASHELRTPLTSLRTNLEVLARAGHLDEADRAALVVDLVAQLEELTVLVGDLADLARESGPEPLVAYVELAGLVADTVGTARRRAPSLDVSLDLGPGPVPVRGDPARLGRAVTNLLDNAAKWGPPGAAVEVSVRAAQGWAEVEVRDHGPGIPPGDLPFVFERFYRAGGDRRLPGSGLGLAIVRQVAEWHGVEALAGAAEGGGARLRLRLPLLPEGDLR